MTKRKTDKKYLAIELILEDGMSPSAAAEMVGETPEIVEKLVCPRSLVQFQS